MKLLENTDTIFILRVKNGKLKMHFDADVNIVTVSNLRHMIPQRKGILTLRNILITSFAVVLAFILKKFFGNEIADFVQELLKIFFER